MIIKIKEESIKTKLRNIVLFNDLNEEILKKIESFTYECKLPKDSILFYEGDDSKYLYLLTLGIVKLYKTSSANRKIVLKYFHAQELIAEVANFEQIPYPATASSFTDVEFLKVDFERLKEYIFSCPELSFKIQTSLIKKIKNLEHVISSDLVLDAKERVAKYICENPENFFIQKNIEIAEILNITPETLSRILKYFRDKNLVDIKAKTLDKENLLNYF